VQDSVTIDDLHKFLERVSPACRRRHKVGHGIS